MTTSLVGTTNTCKLCAPLGASIAFRGIEGAVPFLHGSQGCATYMRRYIISHFREPIDIASSSLSEKHAIYGGGPNLKLGLKNVTIRYRPKLIGVATTCLTETIGDDVSLILKEYTKECGSQHVPLLVHASTPSYRGTHTEGFHAAVRAVIAQLVADCPKTEPPSVNIFPGFVSPADLRWVKDVLAHYRMPATVLPDYADSLDGVVCGEYPLVPEGGTPLDAIRTMSGARASIEWGRCLPPETGATTLYERWGVECFRIGMPIGIRETDRFFDLLSTLSGIPVPAYYRRVRGRLIDAMVDGHKYVFGKRVVIYGEEDLVVGLTSFFAEIGMVPVVCASGGKSGHLAQAIQAVTEGFLPTPPTVMEEADFFEITEKVSAHAPDILVGSSKGYHLSRRLGLPLVRVGFPIHDRIGAQRILHLGYEGAQALFDRVVNILIEQRQGASSVGYTYM